MTSATSCFSTRRFAVCSGTALANAEKDLISVHHAYSIKDIKKALNRNRNFCEKILLNKKDV